MALKNREIHVNGKQQINDVGSPCGEGGGIWGGKSKGL